MATVEEMQINLAQEGLDINNVTTWNGRPKRVRKAPPKTYWEEYVETDEWYLKKLVEDVPPDEMHAAIEDDDLDDVGEEGDSELEEESDFDEPIAPGAMWPWELSDDIPSEESDGETTESTATGSPLRFSQGASLREEAQVYRTPERK
jgi:hypothetical protein